MTQHELVFEGHPVLRMKAEAITEFGPSLSDLVDNMAAVMRQEKGVGLAAPQLGISQRVIVFEVAQPVERDGEAVDAVPLTALVNPEISPVGGEKVEGWEGCLSIPGYRGFVPRWREIRYTAQDIHGQPVQGSASGFVARIIQHEVDHLNGVLYTDLTDQVEQFIRPPAPE